MSISSIEFRTEVRDRLLSLLWRQWIALGVSGTSAAEESNVVDPEALLLLTLTVGRYDSRLFDAVLDWLDLNADYLNVPRLQKLAPHAGPHAQAALGAIAGILGRRTAVTLKWKKLATRPKLAAEEPLFLMADGRSMPMPAACDEVFRRHGLLRSPIIKRRVAQPFPTEGMPSLLLRLRALLGVSVRCEILCLLGANDEIHPSLIARLVGQAPRTTQALLAEMVRSGAVQVRSSARAKHYALVPGVLDSLLRPNGRTPWMNSVPLFQALEIVWLGLMDPGERDLSTPMLASQWRRTARLIRPLLGDAGLGQPMRDDASFLGEDYYDVYVADISRILALV